jgi:hypothetical protein
MSAVYQVNRGVNRPLEFKGIRGPYIIYLGAGLVGLLLLFVILFTAGCKNIPGIRNNSAGRRPFISFCCAVK